MIIVYSGYFWTVLYWIISGYGKSKHDRISMASSFSPLNDEIGITYVIHNFLMGFTILQILIKDPVFKRIYQLIVQKKEKTRRIKSIFFLCVFFQPEHFNLIFYIVLYWTDIHFSQFPNTFFWSEWLLPYSKLKYMIFKS